MMEINSKNLQKEKHKSGPSYYKNLKLSVSSLTLKYTYEM